MWRLRLGYIGLAMLLVATFGALRFWVETPFNKSQVATIVFVIHLAYGLALRFINIGVGPAFARNMHSLSTFLVIGSVVLILLQWNIAPWSPVLTALITIVSLVVVILIDLIVVVALL